MRTQNGWVLALVIILVCFVVTPARGDPLPGEDLTFRQLPLNVGLAPSVGGAPFPGHNELSTAPNQGGGGRQWAGRFMADDFAGNFDSPIAHVKWWGSYRDNFLGDPADPGVKLFLISFLEDVPVSATNPFSRPGAPLLNQFVRKGPIAPGSGTFTETLINPLVAESLFEYNAELHLDAPFDGTFPQKPDTVYWLTIVALPDFDDQQVAWGWHTRDWAIPNPFASTPPAVVPGEGIIGTVPGATGEAVPVSHFQGDAVTGDISVVTIPFSEVGLFINQRNYAPIHYFPPLDGPTAIANFSKDLAFELYSIPEPSAMALVVGAIGIGLITVRRARRAS